MTRPFLRLAGIAAAAVAGVALWPGTAQAHPLGNFSVNHFTGLTLRPGRVDVLAVVDFAEIPTLQRKSRVGDAGAECGRLAAGLTVTVAAERLLWTVGSSSYALTTGAAGLETSRLECRLTAPARLDSPASLTVDEGYLTDRVGWREMTAAGAGVRVEASPLPAASISDELRSYPRDPLRSSPDVRSATIRTGGTGADSRDSAASAAPIAAGPRFLVAAQQRVESVLGGRLSPVVIGLAFLLAILLGAGHAALPGHGKTVMAAFFAGRRGRARDALAVGGTVTLAHTGGVLLVGLLLSTSTALAGERVLAWLGVASGALVTAVGAAMLFSALRSRRHGHSHAEHHHHHHHGDGPRPGGRLGLAGIGLAGGLVPSPSALVVLLGAIGLGRTGLGVLLVLAYGIGMAGTLTAVGLLLVVAQRRLGRLIERGGRAARMTGLLTRLGGRVSASAPAATALLVVVVGLGMGVRAVA